MMRVRCERWVRVWKGVNAWTTGFWDLPVTTDDSLPDTAVFVLHIFVLIVECKVYQFKVAHFAFCEIDFLPGRGPAQPSAVTDTVPHELVRRGSGCTGSGLPPDPTVRLSLRLGPCL